MAFKPHFEPGEHCILLFRKHWFVFLREAIIPLLLFFAPLALYLATASANPGLSISAAAIYAAAIWMLGCWITLAVIWTNFYLDTWMVTEHRVIYIEQLALFSRRIAELRLSYVQDVNTDIHGLIETLLDFGSLRVETAGTGSQFTVIDGIPDPNHVKDVILTQVERRAHRHPISPFAPHP